jgi:hypothetical protein
MQQHEQQAQPQQATGTYDGGYQAPMGYNAGQQQNVTPIAQHPQYQPQAQYQAPMQQMAGGYQPGQWQPHNQSLDNMQAGMQQSRTLDSAPPGASAVPLDLEAYANMSDSDFMGHIDQVKAKMRALMA